MKSGPETRQPFGNLKPHLRTGEFVFVDGEAPQAGAIRVEEIEASVRETDGVTLVVRREVADRLALPYDFIAAWIELGLESDLDLVGLTAYVSSRLAEADISCNVIAGLRHDHLLVPAHQATPALRILG